MRYGGALGLAAAVCAATMGLAASGCRLATTEVAGQPQVRVGSKSFTESVILADIVAHLVRATGASVELRRQLGGTRVLWDALLSDEIDVYAEYTGTISEEILAGTGVRDEAAMRAELAQRQVVMGRYLGFNNTYVIGMLEEVAEGLAIRTISDLRNHPQLKFGFSNEFLDRVDGWPSLRGRYGLPQEDVRGLDHDLAYRGIESRSIDAIDLYSTDAEIRYYGLRTLKDDLAHFPTYQAVLLYRADLRQRAPQVVAALRRLEGRISERLMVEMNARVKLERESESRVAADFLTAELEVQVEVTEESVVAALLRNLRQHLFLVLVSLGAAIVFAVPLGIVAARRPAIGQMVLGAVGIFQTVPSLALFVFLIPWLGIGAPPAIAALFLYSLLPIVRNTYAGLHDIPNPFLESAKALGLPPSACLRLVELPMASRSILAGIKTSAVINVGTATIAAFIGAEGFGQPILTGIRLNDIGLIMQGAVPAALLALAVQGLFDLSERWLVPRGLRLGSDG